MEAAGFFVGDAPGWQQGNDGQEVARQLAAGLALLRFCCQGMAPIRGNLVHIFSNANITPKVFAWLYVALFVTRGILVFLLKWRMLTFDSF